MGAILREEAPKLYVSLSHELSREYREYERTSTTAANAYVGPKVATYLTDLQGRLATEGFVGRLMMMQSSGGLATPDFIRAQPVQLMESGPAGGVVGTMAMCDRLGLADAIAFDMGGTTAKACVVRGGVPDVISDYFVGGYNEGLVTKIPVLDIVEVGTGGGSIAWVEEGGGFRVGPRSAGANPGPASYGRGGTEATITDANVMLGRLAPEAFLGGEIVLDSAAAEGALARAGEALGEGAAAVASGILRVATNSMATVVRQVTLERGLDPRDFAMVAYGGGGALHAVSVARALQIRTVIIPQVPGHFSAYGMLMADFRRDFVLSLFARLDDLDLGAFSEAFMELERTGAEELGSARMRPNQIVFERWADVRYVGQEHAVTIRVPSGTIGAEGRIRLKASFDAAHLARYSHSDANAPVEVVSIRLSAVGRLAKPEFVEIEVGEPSPTVEAALGERLVTFEGFGPLRTTVWGRDRLKAGNTIEGPALVQEGASTTVIGPGDVLEVNAFGHLVISVGRPYASNTVASETSVGHDYERSAAR